MSPVSCLPLPRVSTTPRAARVRFPAATIWALFFLLGVPAAGAAQTLRVGTSGDYPPFSRQEKDGTLRGFDIDLAKRLGADLGMKVELQRFRWPELMVKLRGGKFDAVVSGITMRSERAIDGRYSRPYATTGAVAVIRKVDADRYPSPAALNAPDNRIVVNAGGHLERVARDFFPLASIETIADNLSLAGWVRSEQADAAISDSAEAPGMLDGGLQALGPFTTDYKAILLPAESAELALRIDEWLVERERDGWLSDLRRRWLSDPADPEDAQAAIRQAVVASIALRLGIMPFVAATKRTEKMPVEDVDQEARVLARARERSRAGPERVESVYRLLIRMAKKVQRTQPPAERTIPLPSLRAAIARVDEQLVRELDRLPATSSSAWMPLLAAQLSPLSIDLALQTRLAAALADGPESP